MAATKDFASAKKAVAAVKDAADGKGKADGAVEVGEGRRAARVDETGAADQHQAEADTSRARSSRRRPRTPAGYTAVIAAIAQGTMADTSATKTPEQVKQWQKFSAAMRDDAGAVNAAIHKGDEPAATKAMKKLNQSCEDCHAVFHPGVIEEVQEKPEKTEE